MIVAVPRTALGFDYGEKRIGVAVGQTVTRTASPLVTLPARHGQPDWLVLGKLIDDWRPDCLVVGLPSTNEGGVHPLASAIERFAGRLEGRYHRPVAFIDERLSSHAAAALRRGTRHTLDALAAQQILETWLLEAAQSPEQK